MKSGSRRTTTLYENFLGVLYSRFLLMRTGILMLPKLLDFEQIKIARREKRRFQRHPEFKIQTYTRLF
ncbi:unnamed protein product [Larinioides sclopetarius]|uniref:Uncharacterized protein n=1 Tax=Larinioides sclopetarius TaxID=280406 RepID=A0AAV1Z4B9_9ARAC